jgi:hypothetical protein
MPLASEVLISRGKPYLIRQRQSLDDLIRGEVIPDCESTADSDS